MNLPSFSGINAPERGEVRNPTGVMVAPDPDGQDVATVAGRGLPAGPDTDAAREAGRDGSHGLADRFVNLGDPPIVAPWVGQIVSNERMDGCFPPGRLDFRR
jgi:hypothetical protein